MGFRSARRNASDDDRDSGVRGVGNRRTSRVSSGLASGGSLEQAEEAFGIAVPDNEKKMELQRIKKRNPHRFDGWVEEGMTTDTMEDPQAIKAFRQRQDQRPAEIPTDVERRNKRSVMRSEQTASQDGPAGESGVTDSVRQVVSSSGHSLDGTIQRAMEDRMGDSLGDVRVHTGPRAAKACEDINARAFTVGNHIAFNAGEYDPSSPEGQHVLAHELAHVRQQTGGAVSMLPQQDVAMEIDPDERLERKAEETAQRVMQGGELGIQRMRKTEVHVQRSSDEYTRREVLSGKPSAEETAEAVEEGIDPQRHLEQMVAAEEDIDWVSVFKKAGISVVAVSLKKTAALTAADEIHSQLGDESVQQDDLIAQLEQRDPPQNWVSTIAHQAAEIVDNGGTGNTTEEVDY